MQSEYSEESLNTSDSDGDQIRSEYESEEVCVALFDWDNTLFCTGYLEMLQVDYKKVFSEEKSIESFGAYLCYELQSLEEKIVNMFGELLEMNVRLFIVTNADEKWIKNCLQHFLPELNEFIQENEVLMYSAKKLFGKNSAVEKWKTKCFKKVILDNFTNKNISLKIVTIGDSTEEKLAALALKGLNYHKELTVKFLELRKIPDISILVKQFEYIINNFKKIIESASFYHKIS